ncbi:transmembrane protein 266-like isoform X1 [Takifugu rubripes]|uniref:Transmembrane protein 266 n=1 Tax=Takifugu rubripes TaxID=31033 RepID=A0A674PFZ1_TAKRU|nr:transmembrane protein 266-like isoform X1 [Takifugu rubripes]XP_029701523.1 transmembrane protein 266-like isoform X1 [Takifugu rubripes]XP_029701524.1 transmembrane protein 266-like isoform X1 [Takifugu rubripes]XP_029701525.1 transmembrane protein 266-like isoform X1 [Takifugu rubripes]
MANAVQVEQEGLSDLEVISQPVEGENQRLAPPVQLLSFGYRDLPLATLDLSLAGSQLLSNTDEDDNRDGSNWLKPCCGRHVALWQVCLLSTGFNCVLVSCVILVVLFLSLELLIDTKLLQFSNAFQFASIIHWISLVILSLFFSETVFRIVVLGIWDYIENKVEVFDGAIIVLSLAPMVASTVANGPSSPWDAISLIITLRIWRIKRLIDAYVLQVKVEMELEIQQCERTKAVREEQLERLTQICQEQAFEIRQLRAHLAQQDLDLAAERDTAIQIQRVWGKQGRSFQVVEGSAPGESDDEGRWRNFRTFRASADAAACDDMNNYISQYYSGTSSDAGDSASAAQVTTAAIDVHLPTGTVQSNPVLTLEQVCSVMSDSTGTPQCGCGRHLGHSSHTPGSSVRDCSSRSTSLDLSLGQRSAFLSGPSPYRDPSVVVQELLSSLSEDAHLSQKGLVVDPVNLKLPSPAGSEAGSPELDNRINIFNFRNQEELGGWDRSCVLLQTKPLIHLQSGSTEPSFEEKCRLLGPSDPPLDHLPDT